MAAEGRPAVVLSQRPHIDYSTATHTRAVFLLTAEKRMGQGCVAPSHYGLGSVGLLLWVPSPNQMLAAILLSQDGFGTAKVNDKTNLFKGGDYFWCGCASLHYALQEQAGPVRLSEDTPGLFILLCAFLAGIMNHQ